MPEYEVPSGIRHELDLALDRVRNAQLADDGVENSRAVVHAIVRAVARDAWLAGQQDSTMLLTVNEVAEELRVSTMTVYRLVNSGQLAAHRVGKNLRIPRSAVARYLQRGEVEAR